MRQLQAEARRQGTRGQEATGNDRADSTDKMRDRWGGRTRSRRHNGQKRPSAGARTRASLAGPLVTKNARHTYSSGPAGPPCPLQHQHPPTSSIRLAVGDTRARACVPPPLLPPPNGRNSSRNPPACRPPPPQRPGSQRTECNDGDDGRVDNSRCGVVSGTGDGGGEAGAGGARGARARAGARRTAPIFPFCQAPRRGAAGAESTGPWGGPDAPPPASRPAHRPQPGAVRGGRGDCVPARPTRRGGPPTRGCLRWRLPAQRQPMMLRARPPPPSNFLRPRSPPTQSPRAPSKRIGHWPAKQLHPPRTPRPRAATVTVRVAVAGHGRFGALSVGVARRLAVASSGLAPPRARAPALPSPRRARARADHP